MRSDERAKRIEAWEGIVPAVFKAEDELSALWQPRLAEAKFHDEQTRAKVANDYIHALAVHIVDNGAE